MRGHRAVVAERVAGLEAMVELLKIKLIIRTERFEP